jgi:hypothetical protein
MRPLVVELADLNPDYFYVKSPTSDVYFKQSTGATSNSR